MSATIRQCVQYIRPIDAIVREDVLVSTLLTDSRSLMEPRGALFFALKTRTGDGHKYIEYLYSKGVRSFVVQEYAVDWAAKLPEANIIQAKSSLRALQKIAQQHRLPFSIPVIGITGSNGKTVVKEFLYQLLRQDFRVVRSPRSYNSQIGVPLSVWQINQEHTLGIFEAGISQVDEMEPLARIIAPTVGVFTGIGSAHQENFKSLDEKIEEKLLLFQSSARIVYDADDLAVATAMRKAGYESKGLGWSRTNTEAELFIQDITTGDDVTAITFRFMGLIQTIVIPFIDTASIVDVLHCLGVMLIIKPTALADHSRFAVLEPVAMRLELKEGLWGNIVINDSYNSDLNSLAIALDFQQQRVASRHMKKVVILSDILEVGILPQYLYRDIAQMLKVCKLDKLIAVGKDIKVLKDLMPQIEGFFFASTRELLASSILESLSNSCILVKGARSFCFELVTEKLSRQTHETTLEINLGAVVHNFNYYRAKLRPESRMICMVKAQGYGVGSYELAKTLEEAQADYIAVALADEGKELRLRGINMPIMVMNPEYSAWDTILSYNLEPEIYSERLLDELTVQAEQRGLLSYPIHLKFDTGMHRLGFAPGDADHIGRKLAKLRSLRVSSVFSHLASADDADFDHYTLSQFASFDAIIDSLVAHLRFRPLCHILNTAGMERFAPYQYDMARLGIGLYGVSPSGVAGLMPVARLHTTILQIKTIAAGEPIGYGCRGVFDHDVRIAILPVGYADGYRRSMGNGVGRIYVAGGLCPTVGNICMDTCMVDVTHVEASEGGRATVFGAPGLSIDALAQEMGTIPYELLTSLSPRIKRIYYRE